MSIVTVHKDIDAPKTDVWRALSDIGNIYRFHPLVQRSALLNDRPSGLGAERICHFHDGNSVKERVTGWSEGESMKIEIFEGTMPLSRAVADIRLETLDAGKTRIVFQMDYQPKWGFIGRMMDSLMMRARFEQILGRVLDGLATHLETGAVVGKDGKPLVAEAAA